MIILGPLIFIRERCYGVGGSTDDFPSLGLQLEGSFTSPGIFVMELRELMLGI